jgi:hypothetical protein
MSSSATTRAGTVFGIQTDNYLFQPGFFLYYLYQDFPPAHPLYEPAYVEIFPFTFVLCNDPQEKPECRGYGRTPDFLMI